MGEANVNTILDTRAYLVEFAGDRVTELTANVIASQFMPSMMQRGMNTYP